MIKYKNPELSVEERVEDLLKRMTLEEKVAQMDMIRGVELAEKVHPAHFCAVDGQSDFQWDKVKESFGEKGMGFIHDIYSVPAVLNKVQHYMVEKTRLGIPCIFTGEALHGLSYPGATIFPMPINIGATFHPEIANEVGAAIAAETRSLGIQEILAPNLDLAREPRWGRVEETFGEDTFLSANMAYAIITGEQGDDISRTDKIVTEPKHYCVHGIPEGGTNCSPARVGEREVETEYLPVFEAGIKKAGAYNAMASYNSIDAEAVIASEYYLREILKKRFGLKGYVRADFGAINRLKTQHHMTTDSKDSIMMAVNGGLDVQGFDFPNQYWESTLVELVHEGKISMQVIDEAVSRILSVKFQLGLFEHPYTDEEHYKQVVRCEKNREISLRAARESIVLLQNKNNVLPLRNMQSIAVVGPSSGYQRVGSYSSVPYGYKVPSIYEELKRMAGTDVKIRQCDGCGISERDVAPIPEGWYEDGVELTFFGNDHFGGEALGSSHMKTIGFNWILAKPHRDLEFTGYSVRMRCILKVNTHDFTEGEEIKGQLVFRTGDSVRVYVDNVLVIDSVGDRKTALPECEFQFINGSRHEIEVEFVCDVNGKDIALCLDFHHESMEDAVKLAEESDVVVLVCGDDKITSGEGMDRCDLKLYGKQKELIRRVAELHKPTVLVLESGKPVDLSEEIAAVDGILEAWFGGELGATAIAEVLLGKENSFGRLPVSFPKSVGHLPCYYSRLPGGSREYLEGDVNALFPFGYGLSYTKFEYYDLNVKKTDGPCNYEVTVKVKNIGDREGCDVVQLYVNDRQSSVVRPDKLLKGFKRVHLHEEEEREVSFLLDFDSFRVLNLKKKWVVEAGDFDIMISKNSRETILSKRITIERDIMQE
ncbi:MAG: beta-glucosidase [Lachnospiraceae bacterium]|nr:beta-glucosidase [Lachnospiraceae bacterium]